MGRRGAREWTTGSSIHGGLVFVAFAGQKGKVFSLSGRDDTASSANVFGEA